MTVHLLSLPRLGRLIGVGLVLISGLSCANPPAPPPSVSAPAASVPSQTPSGSDTGRRTPAPPAGEPFEPLRLAWFYKPPSDNNLANLDDFDVFVLTHKDEADRDRLKARHPGQLFLNYFRFNEIFAPASCQEEPYGNQVAYLAGDYCRLSAEHPDWFLRDAQGRPLIKPSGYALMDPQAPGWRAFWLQRAQTAIESWGWDGIFIDNVEASLDKLRDRNLLPAAYQDDRAYQTQIRGFLEYLYQAYFQPRQIPLYANIIALNEGEVWKSYLPVLDGVMLEQFAVDWTDGYLSAAAWEEQLRLVEAAGQLGKHVMLVAQGGQADAHRQTFALASYLLVTSARTSFRYSNDAHYAEVWRYANYALEVGQPLGARYPDKTTWRRDFERGHVIVDPAAHTATIVIP